MNPTIFATATEPSKSTIVLAFFAPEKTDSEEAGYRTPVYKGKSEKTISDLIKKLDATEHFFGKRGETTLLRFVPTLGYANTIALGLGPSKAWGPDVARQAGASLYHIQKKERLLTMAVALDCILNDSHTDAETLQAFCEGYLLGSYEYTELKKVDKHRFHPKGMHLVAPKGSDAKQAIDRSKVIADAVNFARFLGDRPANYMTPTEMGKQVEKMSKTVGLKCTVWGRNQIEKEKMGLFLGVAAGSIEEPKLIQMEYQGGKKGDRPIVLIGKGVTFDSGGISLKPAARMEDMKYDMMGAAAVIGAMQAIAGLKPSVNVLGIVVATENLPDAKAQKPGDVAVSMSGKTVEIINTDAEGRLILADALEYAQKREPQAMIDFATLTGAVLDALGKVASGIMGNHMGLIDRIKHSAEATGERVWQLPLFEEYMEDLQSQVADIKNAGIREAGSSKGGTFLKFFVDSKYPWVHCDIAGTSYHRKDLSYHPSKFGSGVMVRLVAHMVENWKPL
ncbi:MAG: leucyl aminopeptidase [Deltaproteobacteria bacterium]|nr:leucyl aminopeptidase [Deltaproteobacteria bacterium]MBI3295041.1 leucyl aminopeptidase [Deltaproteobacteria bacterium]